jgi:carboxyl-terminal processing protease
MMNRIVSICVFFLFLLSQVNAQMPDSVKRYIDSSLLIMQKHSLYTKSVNWKKIRSQTFSKASHAQTVNETHEALTWAFAQLKDYHGMIRVGSNDAFRSKNPVTDNRQDTVMLNQLFRLPPKVVIAKMGNYGYIRVPHMPQLSEKGINKAANDLKDSVCKLNGLGVQGWIVDLRVNVGGNFRQMIGGLASIFCNRQLGTFQDYKGNATETWRVEGGQMFIGNTQGAKVLNPCAVDCNLPVAVLIGPSTGSSGEITAVSFSSRPNTRFFGERTAGYANSTQGFFIGGNRIYILLTTALASNKKGKLFKHLVEPDVVADAKIKLDVITDDLVKRAVEWLLEKK